MAKRYLVSFDGISVVEVVDMTRFMAGSWSRYVTSRDREKEKEKKGGKEVQARAADSIQHHHYRCYCNDDHR